MANFLDSVSLEFDLFLQPQIKKRISTYVFFVIGMFATSYTVRLERAHFSGDYRPPKRTFLSRYLLFQGSRTCVKNILSNAYPAQDHFYGDFVGAPLRFEKWFREVFSTVKSSLFAQNTRFLEPRDCLFEGFRPRLLFRLLIDLLNGRYCTTPHPTKNRNSYCAVKMAKTNGISEN